MTRRIMSEALDLMGDALVIEAASARKEVANGPRARSDALEDVARLFVGLANACHYASHHLIEKD